MGLELITYWQRNYPMPSAFKEPRPHMVVYDRHTGINYVPPDWYYCGPSDCIWIVPGTLESEL